MVLPMLFPFPCSNTIALTLSHTHYHASRTSHRTTRAITGQYERLPDLVLGCRFRAPHAAGRLSVGHVCPYALQYRPGACIHTTHSYNNITLQLCCYRLVAPLRPAPAAPPYLHTCIHASGDSRRSSPICPPVLCCTCGTRTRMPYRIRTNRGGGRGATIDNRCRQPELPAGCR